jgi:predicted amidohydrolase
MADLDSNHRMIIDAIAEATSAGAQILILPELATSGYVFDSIEEVDACAITPDDPRVSEWAAAIHGDAVVVCGYAERGPDGTFFNSALVFDAGGVLATYRKVHLWDREKLFFTAGSSPAPVVETRFGRIGVIVCYDVEFPEYTRRVAMDGADLIAVTTNWPLRPRPEGERPHELLIAQAAAQVNRVLIACCDRAGTERGQEWAEGTAILGLDGWPLDVAGPGEGREAAADVDLTAGRDKAISPRNHVFEDRRPGLY